MPNKCSINNRPYFSGLRPSAAREVVPSVWRCMTRAAASAVLPRGRQAPGEGLRLGLGLVRGAVRVGVGARLRGRVRSGIRVGVGRGGVGRA